MKAAVATALVVFGLSACGSGASTNASSFEDWLSSHPTFRNAVCQTVDTYGYQAALQAAKKDWADAVAKVGASPKEALDITIRSCD